MRKFVEDCFYCEQNDILRSKMSYLMDLNATSVYLNKDQTNFGRSIVALRKHADELYELDFHTKMQFIEEVSLSSKIIQKITNADKINYAIFGDVVSHLHVHLVPKWREKDDWDTGFINQPQTIEEISQKEFDIFKTQFIKLMTEEII